MLWLANAASTRPWLAESLGENSKKLIVKKKLLYSKSLQMADFGTNQNTANCEIRDLQASTDC